MIRKILITCLVILLGVLSYFTIVNGVKIGGFEAFGITSLKQENEEIDEKISQASKLTSTDYPAKLSELNKNGKTLLSKKEEYTDLTTYSTEEQIEAANELDDYEVEYLWATIGNYATKQGIKIKMDISQASNGGTASDGRKMYDLNFTAEGSYIGIALFLADLQDDSFLEFKIENFSMTGEETLKATFIVKDIPIKIENITEQTTTEEDVTDANSENKNNTNNNTNVNNTTTNTTSNTTNNTKK